jgi:hypothetical protein
MSVPHDRGNPAQVSADLKPTGERRLEAVTLVALACGGEIDLSAQVYDRTVRRSPRHPHRSWKEATSYRLAKQAVDWRKAIGLVDALDRSRNAIGHRLALFDDDLEVKKRKKEFEFRVGQPLVAAEPAIERAAIKANLRSDLVNRELSSLQLGGN